MVWQDPAAERLLAQLVAEAIAAEAKRRPR
jgi:hypothetical protein